MSEEKYYTSKTVGELIPWETSPRSIRNMVCTNRIPFSRVGRRIVFKHSQIIEWLNGDLKVSPKEKEAVK